MAIADITITREREQDVDFTMPYMNLGKDLKLIILYSKHIHIFIQMKNYNIYSFITYVGNTASVQFPCFKLKLCLSVTIIEDFLQE